MKRIVLTLAVAALLMGLSSCDKDNEVLPIIPEPTICYDCYNVEFIKVGFGFNNWEMKDWSGWFDVCRYDSLLLINGKNDSTWIDENNDSFKYIRTCTLKKQ